VDDDDAGDDPDDELDEDPEASPQLREAAERLLARERSRGSARLTSLWTADRDRITQDARVPRPVQTTSAARPAACSPTFPSGGPAMLLW
jgi:chromatin segregation and condensation protein Rec8/ScpA/Scc1 (kleisin family)